MKVYGTPTSPFVRRVAIVGLELGVPVDLVDTRGDAGQARLTAATPLWKVPVAETDDGIIFDSHVIIDWMIARLGHGGLRAPVDRWREHNLMSAIDGALDSAINLFYLKRDGLDPAAVPYLDKQARRVKEAMTWIEDELENGHLTSAPRVGLVEVALISTLDWMVFRSAYPVSDHPRLAAFRRMHAEHPSFKHTMPHD